MADRSWLHSSSHHKLAGLYELKKTLGRGHFAVVRLAQHVFTGENVAIKVIDKTKLDKTSMDHLYHEVTCMKLVQHPNVVRLYEVIETSSKLYLILELGDGGDMYDYIMKHDQGLDEDQAKEYFAQILCAISYCHKMHVVHRDLKPENIVFFESQGLVKLTDFGFSNKYDPGKKLSTSCGSLAYSAPEILLGEEYDAQAVDVWSLGVILYMLVCGDAPFNEANDSETLTKIMDCKYTVLDHVNRDCSDLIKRMIIREPSERLELEDIRSHPWLANCTTLRDDVYNYTPVLTRDLISDSLHTDIVQRMTIGKLADHGEIEEAINENKYNHITSTYYLLAHRGLQAQRKLSDAGQADAQMDASPVEFATSALSASNTRLPQIPVEHLLAKAKVEYSSSPPGHANIVPVSQTGLLTHVEEMNEDSSPASSNSSLYFSSHNMAHLKGDRKMSPPFPREHLTITPRHGFSVAAKGGIDTLIEEEERCRSQTTTDDEDDGMMAGQTEEDITSARIINPAQLASQLQRATIQKRLKKRKSAPVLNEICEENENEGFDATQRPHVFRGSRGAARATEAREVDMVDADVFRSSGAASMRDTLSELDMDAVSNFAARKGFGARKSSLKSSGSETSDDESENRRAGRSGPGTATCNLNRPRRDSSGDRDPSNGNGGGGFRFCSGELGGLGSSGSNQANASQSQASQNRNGSAQDCAAGPDNDNFNNSSQRESAHGEKVFGRITSFHSAPGDGVFGQSAPTPGEKAFGQNALSCTPPGEKVFGRNTPPHPARYFACDIPEKRSRSAESHCCGSRSSSARSSCSSLGYRRGRLQTGRRARRNSRSTASDTRLVLRLSNLRNIAVATTLASSCSASSMGTRRFCRNIAARSEGNVSEKARDPARKKPAKRQYRSTSLPRPSWYACGNLNGPRAASCGPGVKRQWSATHLSTVSIQPRIPESGPASGENAESNVKRSNVSLASSTCSASKYAVESVNDTPLSPMEEEDSWCESREKSKMRPGSLSSGDGDPPTPDKVERIKMTFFSHVAPDGIFRRKSARKNSSGGAKNWFGDGNVKLKSFPGDAGVYAMDRPLLMRKTKPDCCVVM